MTVRKKKPENRIIKQKTVNEWHANDKKERAEVAIIISEKQILNINLLQDTKNII